MTVEHACPGQDHTGAFQPVPAENQHKSKIVATIGPASEGRDVMEQMLHAGMSVARFNFAHGNLEGQAATMERLRRVARSCGKKVALLADLPGPKIRLGKLTQSPLEVRRGMDLKLVPGNTSQDPHEIPVMFRRLPDVVRPGNIIFMNDGTVQLEVKNIREDILEVKALTDGQLFSHKGVNLPDVDLGISALTETDRRIMAFALKKGVDAISVSFVQGPEDILKARRFASSLGYSPFLIAKIERSQALKASDQILEEADGIMVARGDLGVEIPIEEIAMAQKKLIKKANILGKPVITATQMLESMGTNRRPTRAEVTDVANAILDGTDCLMLSEETAMGMYPVEVVKMMASIARVTEENRENHPVRKMITCSLSTGQADIKDVIALDIFNTVRYLRPRAVIVPTRTGATARRVARFRLPVWIIAFSASWKTCQELAFTYGVCPVHTENAHGEWVSRAVTLLRQNGVTHGMALVVEGPSEAHENARHRIEFIDIERE